MELVVLGSGTGAITERRGAPSMMVQAGGHTCLVDSGPGALRQFVRAGGSLERLQHLLYTHAHLDHLTDLWALLFAANTPWLERPPQLHIYGSPAFFEFVERVAEAIGPWAAPKRCQLLKHRMLGEAVELGAARVNGLPVPHIASSLAYRFEEQGRVLVVSGDCDAGEQVVEAARDADLLVLECSTPDEAKVDGHLTPSLCGRLAARAGVRRLVLVHMYPALEDVDILAQVARHYDGPTVVAEDLQRFQV
jgi:ribonuclease BN (tRNA processing enzyme)